MRKMKNSDIKWVGKIPAHWATHPMYYYFNQRRCKNYLGTETNLLSLSYGRIVRKDINSLDGLIPESYNTYNIIEENDIVFRLTDLQNDKNSLRTGIAKNHGIITSAYVTVKPIKLINASYFHYLLHSYDINKVFYNMGNGVRQGLNFDELSKLMLVEPPIEEQNVITAYLNQRCAEVDGISADIQKQIEVLEEYKRSIITEAVTKGLDPNTEMSDSTIEWVDSLPTHWSTTKIGYSAWLRARLGWKGLKSDEYVAEGYPFLSAFNIVDSLLSWDNLNFINEERYIESPEIMLNIGDVLLVKDGAGIGKCARIDALPMGKSTTNGSLAVITTSKELNYKYLYYYFLSAYFQNYIQRIMNGMGVPHLSQEELRKIVIPLPPTDEQERIADYLDNICDEILSVIIEKKKQIATIEEYKKSLIYEYVTGKKEAIAETTVSVAISYNILLAIVLDKIKNHEGKTQVLKLMYLVNQLFYPEHKIQYYRYEHGPYDMEIDSNLLFIKEQEWFNIDIHKSPMLWDRGENYQAFKKVCQPFSKHIKIINNLIKSVENCTTKQLERFATLFAVWNDFIIDGIDNPSDEEIITEVLNNWTPNKKNFKKSTWQQSLDKMRVLDMIPKGNGLHTKKKGEK